MAVFKVLNERNLKKFSRYISYLDVCMRTSCIILYYSVVVKLDSQWCDVLCCVVLFVVLCLLCCVVLCCVVLCCVVLCCVVPLSPTYAGCEHWKCKRWANHHALCKQRGCGSRWTLYPFGVCPSEPRPLYVCTQQCVPCTFTPQICQSTKLHTYIHIHLRDIQTYIETDKYMNTIFTWIKH